LKIDPGGVLSCVIYGSLGCNFSITSPSVRGALAAEGEVRGTCFFGGVQQRGKTGGHTVVPPGPGKRRKIATFALVARASGQFLWSEKKTSWRVVHAFMPSSNWTPTHATKRCPVRRRPAELADGCFLCATQGTRRKLRCDTRRSVTWSSCPHG